jgi:uncharacterized protein involved in exopolysaccharide biosynthesis
MPNSQFHPLNPQAALNVIRRHKKKLLACPLLAIGLGVLVLLYFPRSYRSQAQIFLRLGRESVGLDPTATTGHTISLQQGDRKDEVKSVIEVIKSRGVISQVVDQLGPEVLLGGGEGGAKPGPLKQAITAPLRAVADWFRSLDPVGERERAIILVERHLYAAAERGSTLVEIAYEAKTPQLAQTVCSAFVDVYRQEHMRIQRSDESRPFFEEQQDRLRQQLDGSLTALRDAKNEMGLADITGRRATLEAQFSAVELDRLATQQQSAGSQARVADLEQQLARVPERLLASKKNIPNAGADLLRDQLYSLQMKSMDLQARYTEKYPRVQAVTDQLKEAENVLAGQAGERTETTDDVNPIHRQLALTLTQERNVLAGLKARLIELDSQSKTVLADLRLLNGYELKLDQLNRDAKLARDKFYQYAKNLEEARIDKALEAGKISNLSVVQSASLNERPVTPSRPLVALAALLLATAGTAVVVMASEWAGERFPAEGKTVSAEREAPVMGPRRGGFGREVSAVATASSPPAGA